MLKKRLMDIQNVIDKKIALILWAKDENKEDDVCVYSGIFKQGSKGYFIDRLNAGNLEIREEWLSRIRLVEDELKDTLMNCDYSLSLSVGSTDETNDEPISFGLKWAGK